jgi:hypothetical protein
MPPQIDRPNADSGAAEISIGMWVADISSIDSAQQTFTAEIAVVLRWKDPRLVHTGNGIVRYPLEQIWHPRVGIVNETNSVSRKMPDSVEVDPNGMVTYRPTRHPVTRSCWWSVSGQSPRRPAAWRSVASRSITDWP